MINKVELLAPAGDISKLKTAIHFGADAVYCALNRHGLRAYAGNFDFNELAEAINFIHKNNKKIYLTLNSMPEDNMFDSLLNDAKKAYQLGIDAAIVSDIGVISVLHSEIPRLKLHISTQANTLNSFACKFYKEQFNVERIILARELSLESIKYIRMKIPNDLQLEAFVHGAMCMAYSGRCILSNAMTGRGGNQGACAQSCRWKYSLVEAKRPGEAMPIYQDEHGTYILSSYDLCMIDHLPDLINVGLSSLKIEGRMKSEYYVATVTATYRRAIDAIYSSEEEYFKVLPALIDELDKVGHRASNTGFFYGNPSPASGADGVFQSMEYVAQIIKSASANEETEILMKNRFFVGDELEVLSPNGTYKYIPNYIKLNSTGEFIKSYGVANEIVLLSFPFSVNSGDILRGPNRNNLR